MDEKQFYTIIMRHDTSTQWAANNPILTLGEYAVEDDTHRVKRGDGETEWNDLPYEEFGLVYLVTYKNLSGEVSDNEALQQALDKKMSLAVFEDNSYAVVSSIDIVAENGAIGRLTKLTKDIDTALTTTDIILIKSSDNSVQGYWSTDTQGVRILNLRASCTITDYEVGKRYYKDHLCFYQNRLYRAVEDFEAESDFYPNHWVILASKHAEDIAYDNLQSELDATTVQEALDELKRRNDTKVSKSTEHKVVYATTNTGAQTVIPIDDLRTVDTVNGVAATDQESKNIQIDASDINYDDEAQEPETIKEKLDQKVDKTVAGVGAKIVRDVQFNYNTETGHITLVEDKVSLEDGSSAEEEVEIDVVSAYELAENVATINNTISNAVETLNFTIENLRADVNTEVNRLDGRIDGAIEDYTAKVTNLAGVVANNKLDIENKLNVAVVNMTNYVDIGLSNLSNFVNTEVSNLSNFVNTSVSNLSNYTNVSISNLSNYTNIEISNLSNYTNIGFTNINSHITNEISNLSAFTNNSVSNLFNYVNSQDNLKVDKDIADNLVVSLDVATHDNQPTIKFTSKSTTTKNPVYDYVHFGTNGHISVRMADADHLIIDSTAIDTIDAQQNTRLNTAEGRLDAHDSTIASLQEHDLAHDRLLATHTNQIALHETRLDTDEASILALQGDLETEAGAREDADNALSARITTNAVNITTKADKEFADHTDDKVVGKIESDTIANSELINLKEIFVSPVDGSYSTANIKIISSDGTVVATRANDGTIDLAANLDTDVNYFVTTETINVTIATETTLDMTKLTPTDKVNVEVQDIISDPEGTWGRVKSINAQNNTCVVVTFKKHAQAVWGTIKGTLADQLDLKALLDGMQTQINKLINDLDTQIQTYEQGEDYTVNGNYTHQNYVTFTRSDGVMLMAKVLVAFIADDTETDAYESFKVDVSAGNLELVGIPEQVGSSLPDGSED